MKARGTYGAISAALGLALGILASSGGAAPADGRALGPGQFLGDTTLARGVFLVARRQVTGFFEQTVLLLLEHTDDGALAVIINQPSELTLAQLLPDEPQLEERPDRVYRGGPVSLASLIVLRRSAAPPADWQPVVADVHLSRGTDALHAALLEPVPVQRIRVYVGYAGWAPGQLVAEIERGDWLVVGAVPDLVFDAAPEKVWPHLIHRHDGLRVQRRPATRSGTWNGPEGARARLSPRRTPG